MDSPTNPSFDVCCPMDDFDLRAAHKPVPPPSEAVKLEVEALRSMLGLPSEPDERAPPGQASGVEDDLLQAKHHFHEQTKGEQS